MKYLHTPLSFTSQDATATLRRDIPNWQQMLDNLIELIVFTPKGSFLADPDFGFEYWNHEYSNIHYRNFNNGQALTNRKHTHTDITKIECQESIRNSLDKYAPILKNTNISITLNAASDNPQKSVQSKSKHLVRITVEGTIQNDLGTSSQYQKEIMFLMEPTLKTPR